VGQPPVLLKQQQLSCRTSLVIALLNMAFGHYDPQTIHHLTSVCGDFLQKEPTATTQEAWGILSFRLNSCWPAMTNKLFEKVVKNSMKWVNVYFQEGGGHFSIWCNYTLFITLLVSLQKYK
jgi:hypothetical protein